MDDHTLLRIYARDDCADAFARLVERYVNLVYSAAARQVGRTDHAEDVTQAVFLCLARRARAGALNKRHLVLSAWLLTATRYAAIDALKREARRRKHEQRAATMRSEIQHPDGDSQSESESMWEQVKPVLDAAMLSLSEKDRRAVALRYFESRSFEEVGAALGATRQAAKQRVFRAIERLRAALLGNGVAVSATALGSLIGANAVLAAPPALAGACAAAATASAAAATAAGASAFLNAATWVKAKLTLSAVAATLIVGTAAVTLTTLALRTPAQANQVRARAPVIPAIDPAPRLPAAAEAPANDPDDWWTPFVAAYAPKDGQAVRLVPPPFIPQRWNWWKTQQPGIRPLKPGEKMFEKMFVIEFDGGQFKWTLASVVDGNIYQAMRWAVGLRPWETIGPDELRNAALPGDWVWVKGAKREQKVADVARIAGETLKRKIAIRPVTQKLDVVVARGTFVPKMPADERGRPIIEVGLGEKVEAAPGAPSAFGPPRSATMRQVFDEAEELTQIHFIDESGWGMTRMMMQRYVGHQKSPKEELRRLMTRLMEQTGLELEIEQRDTDVWEVSEEK